MKNENRRRAAHVKFYGQDFVPCDKKVALGAIEYYSLGGTGYFIQVGSAETPKWTQVERDEYERHLQATR